MHFHFYLHQLWKRAAFLCALSCLGFSATAQFHITPNGVACTTDSTGYYNISAPKLTAEQLYNSVTRYFLSYFSPRDVSANGQPYETLIVSLRVRDAFVCRSVLWNPLYADAEVSLPFRFKNGKMRIDPPYVNGLYYRETDNKNSSYSHMERLYVVAPDWVTQLSNICMYSHKGKPASERSIKNFDNWLNRLVNRVATYVQHEGGTGTNW